MARLGWSSTIRKYVWFSTLQCYINDQSELITTEFITITILCSVLFARCKHSLGQASIFRHLVKQRLRVLQENLGAVEFMDLSGIQHKDSEMDTRTNTVLDVETDHKHGIRLENRSQTRY